MTVEQQEKTCSVTIEDDGAGVTEEKLEELNNAPHYMMCDENVIGQRMAWGFSLSGRSPRSTAAGWTSGTAQREDLPPGWSCP